MALDPQVEKLLTDMAQSPMTPLTELRPEQARRQMAAANAGIGKPQEVLSIEDTQINVDGGHIELRIYRGTEQTRPAIVYYHGGGWVLGSIETHDGYCRALANEAQAVVVSVEYRLAPEHLYPTAAEDCYAATKWVSENADEIGVQVGRLVVAGDSAGGNLAAAVALMARDRGGPEIDLQVLIYPITDHNFETASYKECGQDYMLTQETMVWFWDHYCPDTQQRNESYASPLRADDLANLPPALVQTAGYDPLCTEGDDYADKLKDAGVQVIHTCYEGMIHGFTRRFAGLDKATDALQEIGAAYREFAVG